jgi:hypothetical protein
MSCVPIIGPAHTILLLNAGIVVTEGCSFARRAGNRYPSPAVIDKVGQQKLLRQAMQPLQAPRCTSGGNAERFGASGIGWLASPPPAGHVRWGLPPPFAIPLWEHIEDIEDNENRAQEHRGGI